MDLLSFLAIASYTIAVFSLGYSPLAKIYPENRNNRP